MANLTQQWFWEIIDLLVLDIRLIVSNSLLLYLTNMYWALKLGGIVLARN